MLRIGFAEEDITPPLGPRMAGHFRDDRVEGIHDPLHARAMAITGGGPPGNEITFVFISCDLLSIRRGTVMAVRRRIEEATGIPGDCITVNATHTHTGPAASRIFGMDPDEDYVRMLEERIAQAGIEALQRRQPGSLTVAYGFEGKLTHQRRFIMRDGTARMHPPKGGTDILYQEGPSDPEFGVLWGADAAGKPLGCWVNYACHVNTVGGGSPVSADYPGYLATAMKSRQHEKFVTLFGNGCCGNLCAIDVYDPDRDDRGHEWAQYMGERLADDVLGALPEGEKLTDPLLDHRAAIIPMPSRHLPEELLVWARDFLEAADENTSFTERCYASMALEMLQAQRLEPLVNAEIDAFRLGDYALVTLPGEIFTEFGLDIKLKSPAKRTFVMELANGIVGYVPTKRAFEGGGYEQRTA
ncbi:MAG: hypothetical protein KKI08_18160, partial [Armatimonadetes bacterium]|nr:hypothetical protein [Armatimonadota bacterium]